MMDIRSARNPAIVLAILASGDHAYYASDKALHDRQSESAPHGGLAPTSPDVVAPVQGADDVADRAEPEVVVLAVRQRDLTQRVG